MDQEIKNEDGRKDVPAKVEVIQKYMFVSTRIVPNNNNRYFHDFIFSL